MYVLVPFQIRREGNPEISLCINVLHNFTIDSVFGYNGMMLSCDAEYFTFLGIEFKSPTQSPFLYISGFGFKRTCISWRFNYGKALCVISELTDGEDIDDGRSFT